MFNFMGFISSVEKLTAALACSTPEMHYKLIVP